MQTIDTIKQSLFIKAANKILAKYNELTDDKLSLSRNGICAGFSSVFTSYAIKGEKEPCKREMEDIQNQINQFVTKLEKVIILSKSKEIDEDSLQEAVNFIKKFSHLQDFYHEFGLSQYNYLKSIGMTWVNSARFKFDNFFQIGETIYPLISDSEGIYNISFATHSVMLIRRGEYCIYFDPNFQRIEIFSHQNSQLIISRLIHESIDLIKWHFPNGIDQVIEIDYQIEKEQNNNRKNITTVFNKFKEIIKHLPEDRRLDYSLMLNEIKHDYFQGKQPAFQLVIALKLLVIHARKLDAGVAKRIREQKILTDIDKYIQFYKEKNVNYLPHLSNPRRKKFEKVRNPTRVLFFGLPISQGWINTQKALISNGYYLIHKNEYRQTAFHLMCQKKYSGKLNEQQIECLSLLYAKYNETKMQITDSRKTININQLDSNGKHALHYIAENNNVEAAKILFRTPGLVTQFLKMEDNEKTTPLQQAILSRSEETLEFFLKNCVLSAKETSDLLILARSCDNKQAKALLKEKNFNLKMGMLSQANPAPELNSEESVESLISSFIILPK